MNIFNRIIVVLILIFFIAASLVSIVNEFAGFFKWSEISSGIFNPETNINPYISTLALLMVIVVCVLLLLLEFYRRKRRIAKIYNVESGKAMITVDTIAQQIKDSVLGVNGLKNLKVDIIPKSAGIIINMMVELNQNLNISEKMTEIIKAARDVATERLSIKVIDTKLTITSLIPEESKSYQKEEPEKQKLQETKKEQKIDIGGPAIHYESDSEKDSVSDEQSQT